MELETIIKINDAVIEARRFVKKAVAWKKRINSDDLSFLSGTKEGGAAKRASMDLTRALAELRKS